MRKPGAWVGGKRFHAAEGLWFLALLMLAITSYVALMFTGSTTFTTLAGVRLEVRRALPAIIGSAGLGLILRVAASLT